MASAELSASAPGQAPPAPPPQSSAPPPPSPSPPPPPPHSPPPSPPPEKATAPVSLNDASDHQTSDSFIQSFAKSTPTLSPSPSPPPPVAPPTSSPPPPASSWKSPPPTSLPPPSPSPPPAQSTGTSPSPSAPLPSSTPQPSSATSPSHQTPTASTASPPPLPPPPPSKLPVPAVATPSAPPTPGSAASALPALIVQGAPPAPPGTTTPNVPPSPPVPTNETPPGPTAVSSGPQVVLPALTTIMPGSPGTSQNSSSTSSIASPVPPAAGGNSTSSGGSVPKGVFVGVGVAGFLVALVLVFAFLVFRKKWKKRSVHGPSGRPKLRRKNTIVVPDRVASPDVYHPSNAPSPTGVDFSASTSWFTYDELVDITSGFSQGNVIGEGGFGRVYKGALLDGKRVAVKQLKVESRQGEKEFRAEVEIISRIHHRNLVTLVGHCVTDQHRLLVYEFVPNETLEHHLHGKGMPLMDWPKRMKIAIGSARGLAYLHEDCHPRIIHRDIKSPNILLDDAFEAKVADFGLAKFTNDSLTHISTRVMGTFGYMAPEYASSGKLTDRSDVFSFGVVLLELITGRKPVDASQPLGEESLVEWARPLLVSALEKEDFEGIADPSLQGNYSKVEMHRMVEAAAACIRHSATKRPRMVQVSRSLDIDGSAPDLTNGVKFGQSTAYDSSEYSADIENFRRMAFAGDISSAELGFSEDDEEH